MWLCCMNLGLLAGLFSCCTLSTSDQACISDARVEPRLDIRADEREAVTRIRGFFAALFCGFCVHLVWGGGMYARFWRAYVVATEV